MPRRKRCPKCGRLGEHHRMTNRKGKQWDEYIHASKTVSIAGILMREIQSGDWCYVPTEPAA